MPPDGAPSGRRVPVESPGPHVDRAGPGRPVSTGRPRYASAVSDSGQPNSAADVAARAAEAYEALAGLAESVEDEWQYVTDLVDAYLPSIRGLAGENPGRALPVEAVEAVDEAIAEIALITDPHRAIDWLSTFPHVVALAMGGDVDRTAGATDGAGGRPDAADLDAPEPDDSPFRMLRGPR
jgi:hypothetical protein